MVRNNFFTAITIVMMMTSANTYAQGARGGQMMQGRTSNRSNNHEMTTGNQMGNRGGQAMMGGNQMNGGRDYQMGGNQMGGARGNQMGGARADMRGAGMPHVDARGFVPGWEGRVMYRDGRWGYLRGADWYWYDTYFDPDFYFGRPLDYFRPHFIPVDHRVAGAVAGTVAGAVAVGTLLSMLIH